MRCSWGNSALILVLLCVWLARSQTVNAAPLPAKGVSPCESGSRASSAILQAARQTLPLQQRAALKDRTTTAVKVQSWAQLVEAVERVERRSAPSAWTVFELQLDVAVVATSTLRLQPGMAVVAGGTRQRQGARIKLSCQEGLDSAFDVRMAGEVVSSPASSAGVLLQGLHISGCGGSAVRVSGSLSPAQGVQWGQLPAGLHLVDTHLTSNGGAAGSALSASRVAVYMDAVEVANNTASQLGAGVRIDQGLLVALKTTFTGNKAGSTSQVSASSLTDGSGGAIFANSSTLVLANSSITRNSGASVGGCAIKAIDSKGIVIAGCSFHENACTGDGGAVMGGNYAAAMCAGGGASLMVSSNMPRFVGGKPTQCSLAPKHLVHISDTTFTGDIPTKHTCGGSIMLDASWFELHRSSIANNKPAERGGALGSKGSAVIIQDSRFNNHSTNAYGGSVFQLRGRFWASGTLFSDSFNRKEGGGCVYITDATEVRVSNCSFERCICRAEGAALYYQMTYDKLPTPPPFSIDRSKIVHCRAFRDGGALSLNHVNVNISDTLFDGNEGYYGGVLNAGNGPLSVSRTNFTNNMASAGGQGGTIYSFDMKGADITDCTWYNNTAYQGAAVYAATYGGEAEWVFTRCNFTANVAQQRGAALWTSGTNHTFVDTVFDRNTALTAAGVFASSVGTELPLRMVFDKCTLERNSVEQTAGVAWVTGYKNLTFTQCSITDNYAGQSAAGLYLEDTPTRLSGCTLARNTASLAAALVLHGANSTVQAVNSRFDSNEVTDQGGAGLLTAGSSLTLTRTALSNNSASTAGGALVLLDGATLSCSGRCNFTNNTAALGGAVAVDSASLNLMDAVLVGNYAPSDLVAVLFGGSQQHAGAGGAVFGANATISMARCRLQDNRAEAQGGAVQLMSSTASLMDTSFVNNRAAAADVSADSDATATAIASKQSGTAGGAIAAGLLPAAGGNSTTAASQLRLQDCKLSGNTAGFGGAIAALDTAEGPQAPTPSQGRPAPAAGPAAAMRLVLASSTLANNNAQVSGGAVFSNLPSASLSLTSSRVDSNTAGQGGGGIAAVTPAAINLNRSTISRNSAAFCAGMLLDAPAQESVVHSSRFEGNVAGRGGSSERTFGQLPQWNSTGSGGGLCIIPGGPVSVTKTVITRNTALHGAGMFVQDCVSRKGTTPAAEVQEGEHVESLRDTAVGSKVNSNACRVTVGSQTVISGNKQAAGGSGSALYTTDTAAVNVAPDARAGKVHNRSSVITEAGAAAAVTDSMAAQPSAVLGGFQQQRGADSLGPVLIVESGKQLPAVKLRLVDELGQELPPSLLQQLTFRAQAAATRNDSQSDTNLLGVTSVVPSGTNSSSGGEVHFDWLELQGAPGETLNVSFAVLEAPQVTPAVVQVQVKHCQAGQAVLRGRRPDLYAGCTNCTNPLFSFDPTASQCSTCPPAGTYKVCSRDVVTPADGYWQSHPRSAQLLACPNPAACSRSSAAGAELAAASAAMASAQQHTTTRNLLSEAQQEKAVAGYQQLQCAPGFTGNLCSNCERSSRVSQTLSHTCRSCNVSRAGSIVLFILLRFFDLSIVLLSVFLVFKERQRRNMAVNSGGVTADSIRLSFQQGKPLQMAQPASSGPVETQMNDLQPTRYDADSNAGVDTYLMMFIEFMQLLSIFRLTRISVVWRSAAEAVLLAMSITPISSYSWVSLECLMGQGLSPQQYAFSSTLATTYVPVALVCVVCVLVLLHVARQARRLRYKLKDFPALVPELVLAAVKAIAYGYPVVVGSVLGLFSCKRLDSSAAQLPGEVNAAQGNFWNRDLDTVCFQGSHLTYALAVGLPMLLLIVLYPLVQILLLRRQARKTPDGLCEVGFWANYSMLYQDYTERMYLWGSVRELRQLLLVAVVVVLQAYPVQLQMAGGWLLSLALLLSHASLLPFRTGLLNGLQTAMLAAFSFTFYAGVLSSLSGFPAAGAAALQYIAIAFNILVALVLLGVLVWRARLWLDFDKDGKVTWTDVKLTLQQQGELTGKAASVVVKRMASLASTASRSNRGSTKIAAKVGSSRVGDPLTSIDSQCLAGFNSVNYSLADNSSFGLPSTNHSLSVLDSHEVPSRGSSSPPGTIRGRSSAGTS